MTQMVSIPKQIFLDESDVNRLARNEKIMCMNTDSDRLQS